MWKPMDRPRWYYAKWNVSQRKTNIIWFHLLVESKKQHKQTKQKQTHRYRGQTDGWQMGGGLGGWVKKVTGLRSTNQ